MKVALAKRTLLTMLHLEFSCSQTRWYIAKTRPLTESFVTDVCVCVWSQWGTLHTRAGKVASRVRWN